MVFVRMITFLVMAFQAVADTNSAPPIDQRAAARPPDGQWHNSNDPETFTPQQLKALKDSARRGDHDAAYRVYYHYEFGDGMNEQGSREKAIYRLRVAAKGGLPMAEHNLGTLLSISDSGKDRAEAQFWLKRGAKDGVPVSDQ